MKSLLKLEFIKLRKQKCLYICTGIMVGMMLIVILTTLAMEKILPGEMVELLGPSRTGITSLLTALNDGAFTMIAGIFVALFLCEDFDQKTIKNIYARGYDRKRVYLAKIAMVFIGATAMYAVLEVASFAVSAAFFGIGEGGGWKLVGILGTQYLAAMANTALTAFLASWIRRGGLSVVGVIVTPMVLDLALSLADVFVQKGTIRPSHFWVTGVLIDTVTLDVSTERLLCYAGGAVVYIILFLTCGWRFHKKAEV